MLFEGLKDCDVTCDYINDEVVFSDGINAPTAEMLSATIPEKSHTNPEGYIVLDHFKPKK